MLKHPFCPTFFTVHIRNIHAQSCQWWVFWTNQTDHVSGDPCSPLSLKRLTYCNPLMCSLVAQLNPGISVNLRVLLKMLFRNKMKCKLILGQNKVHCNTNFFVICIFPWIFWILFLYLYWINIINSQLNLQHS